MTPLMLTPERFPTFLALRSSSWVWSGSISGGSQRSWTLDRSNLLAINIKKADVSSKKYLLPLRCHGDLPPKRLLGVNTSSMSSIVDLTPNMSKSGARELSRQTCETTEEGS